MSVRVLFLHESSLPTQFTTGTVTGREMRLLEAQDFIQRIYAVCRGGTDFITTYDETHEPKIEVIRVKASRKNLRFVLELLARAIQLSKKSDIIHAESPLWSGIVGLLVCKIARIPFVVEIRSDFISIVRDNTTDHYGYAIPSLIKRLIVKGAIRIACSNASAVIANSQYHLRQALSLGATRTKSYEISPGVALNRSIHRTSQTKITLGFVGRLVPLKGVEYFLHALSILLSKGFTGFEAIIVGEGPQRIRLETLARDLNLGGFARFVGAQPSSEWMSRFDILVNPSVTPSALDTVNIEAYLAGTPVVAAGVPGKPETVVDGVTGIIVPPINADALANAILYLCMDESTRHRMAAEGARFAERRYSFERQVASMKTVYMQVLRLSPEGDESAMCANHSNLRG